MRIFANLYEDRIMLFLRRLVPVFLTKALIRSPDHPRRAALDKESALAFDDKLNPPKDRKSVV